MVQSFFKERLVDQIGLTVDPRLLGDGISLFPPPHSEMELKLTSCEP
jgi:riboflavin biosynthesis pyrimidine reductase